MTSITEEMKSAIMKQAKGDYQRSLLYGNQSWAGSNLTGAARNYSASYYRSRRALIARIREAIEPHGWGVVTAIDKSRGNTRRLFLISPEGIYVDRVTEKETDDSFLGAINK